MQIDFPYIIFLLILISFTLLSFKGRDKRMFKYSCILTFLFIGLRAPIVGADTWDYYRFFIGVRNYYNEGVRELEPSFELYVKFMQTLLFKEGLLIMLANTFLSFVVLYFFIKKLSSYKTLSVLLFFLIGPWVIYFVALRQILGLSLFFYGVYYVLMEKDKKWLVYFICSLIGLTMHSSIIIVSLLYLILHFLPIKSKIIAIISISFSFILGAIFKSLDIDKLFSFLLIGSTAATQRLDVYLEAVNYIEEQDISIYLLLCKNILAFLVFFLIPPNKINHWLSKVYFFGVCCNNLFFSVLQIDRFLAPFNIFAIIVVTWGVAQIPRMIGLNRIFLKLVVTVVLLYFVKNYFSFSINYDIYDNAKMHPYDFYFEDYSRNPIFFHPDIS